MSRGPVYPEHGPGKVAWLLVYPDTYEIGLPNQGLQILYEILNERPDALAERAYAPWVDMEAAMREAGVPLFSVEQHLPAAAFDVLAFNLSAELVYTNVLNLIDLAGFPLHAADRGDADALVVAGGHCAFNPEPLADFVDAFVLGDGEEVVGEVNEVVAAWLEGSPPERRDRRALLRALARLEGVYVPALYAPVYADGRLTSTRPVEPGVPAEVAKRTVGDLADWPYPSHPLVPLTEVVHDRLNVEVFRGCTRGCRFCQAGMITRPVRERPAAQVRELVRSGLEMSGYDEVTLTSLSTADFSGIEDTVREIVEDPELGGRVSVSLPSLRVDAFTVATAAEIQKVRRTGLTFAPEGGTWRMRQVINKLITEEDLYGAVDAAFSQGWRRVKLYFLIGLPTELDEDVLGIAELGAPLRRDRSAPQQVGDGGGLGRADSCPSRTRRSSGSARTRRRSCSARSRCCATRPGAPGGSRSAGTSRPPRWPRGWPAGATGAWVRSSSGYGGPGAPSRSGPSGSTSRCGRSALAAEGLSTDEVCHRDRAEDEALPWDHISAGLHRDFLWQDWQDALAQVAVEDCRWTPCYDCGACTGFGLEHVVASPVPPAGGSQGTGPGPERRGPDPGPPGRPCLLRPRAPEHSADCVSASPRPARSASPATATWPACGSGPCGGAGCPWPTRRASRPTRW